MRSQGGLVLYCLTGRASSTVFVSTLFLVCNCIPVCRIFNDQTAEQLIWRSFAAARHFCSAKILAGGLPAQRNFQRKFALRRVGSYKFVVPPTSNHSKVRNNARQESTQYRAAPGCQRDRGPFCFGKSPEEPLPRGSFGQLLRGGSTPRFFSQIRSVGSKKDQLAATASNHTGACRHGRQQKLTVPPSQRQTPPAGGNSPAKPPARSCLPAHTAPCRASSPDILPGRDENHS